MMRRSGISGAGSCFRRNFLQIALRFLNLLFLLTACSFGLTKMCSFGNLGLMNSIEITLFFFLTLFDAFLFSWLSFLSWSPGSFDLGCLLCVLLDWYHDWIAVEISFHELVLNFYLLKNLFLDDENLLFLCLMIIINNLNTI